MTQKIIVGWREMLALPELGIEQIKAKVDTGARSSCLHTFKIDPFEKDDELWVRFWIHPIQKNDDFVQICEAKVIDQRTVKDSGGHEEQRYVIETMLSFNGEEWPIEVTLTNRENMLFRMLLGRTAMNNRIIVDPAASFLIATPFNPIKDHDL
ncbi:ATP-dependent zinc protease family protein [Vibrio rumoiensis]|uniref:Ribosomal protein S6 modification protein n=1 Tax=Vibrio rumoiensis 1S-45 TaxID=1188252 RepID=A0A1E5DZW2_9VIBR|nr:ATP-dependent zinc protease [Vibrio rumoiensis]OEF23617.1 ribosomal protein S6 modification protein [Vibrio rumoiensis 1S-45]